MKIQLASDIHLEFHGHRRYLPPPNLFESVPDRDLLILAGDIGTGMLAEGFVARELETSPIVLVPGNHEYYGHGKRSIVDNRWNQFASRHDNMHYTVMETVEIRGVRIAGTPWYTDFWGDPDVSKYRDAISDFSFGDWTPEKHLAAHGEETEWLRRQAGKADIVVTHWPPTKEAIHPRFIPYPECKLNPYFINDREDVVREVGAAVWCSGHTHEAYSYTSGKTLCIANPSGYPFEEKQSWLFRPDYVFEI